MNDSISTLEYRDNYRIRIVYEDCPESPREWSNVSKMLCWHKHYNLGDEHSYESPKDFLKEVIEQHPSAIRLAFMKLKHGHYDKLRLRREFSNDKSLWYIDEFYENKWLSVSHAYSSIDPDEIGGELIELLETDELMNLCHPYMEYSMLSIYDHSGVTIYCGSPCDRWDSGYVGFAVIMKEDAIKEKLSWCNETNWREAAQKQIRGEVETYDQYIRGEVYGYIAEHQDEDGNWEYVDSCYGFYHMEACIDDAKDIIDTTIKQESATTEERLGIIRKSIAELCDKVFVWKNKAYCITKDMFGQFTVQCENMVHNCVPKSFMNDINLRDLPETVQIHMFNSLNID